MAQPRPEQAAYAYPADLARFVRDRWSDTRTNAGETSTLPDMATTEKLLSACYQASLLRDEERPVTFRAIFAPPGMFSADGIAPHDLQRLAFSRTLPFNAPELKRLSVAFDAQRTLVGIDQEEDGRLRIWGLINSGTRLS